MKHFKAEQYILLIIILITASLNQVFSQSRPICYQCNKNITERYIKVDGKMFHPEHFLCELCSKVIEGEYQSKDGKFFHPDCFLLNEGLICDYCEKVLEVEYTVSEGKKYHTECLEKFILPKCSICGLNLKESYLVDNYRNKYHSSHKAELNECDCCGRLICKSLTVGGREYSDGRHICNLCFSTAVAESRKFDELNGTVISKLKFFGIRLDGKIINVTAVDRNTLQRRSENYSGKTRGFCDSHTRTESVNGRVVKKITTHNIYVLSGMPLVLTESTIAHELMHAWLYDNTKDNHPARIREGSCNYISYIYLKSLDRPGVSDFITMLEKDPSPVYGKGFLEIRSKFEGRQTEELLNYLKQ